MGTLERCRATGKRYRRARAAVRHDLLPQILIKPPRVADQPVSDSVRLPVADNQPNLGAAPDRILHPAVRIVLPIHISLLVT